MSLLFSLYSSLCQKEWFRFNLLYFWLERVYIQCVNLYELVGDDLSSEETLLNLLYIALNSIFDIESNRDFSS